MATVDRVRTRVPRRNASRVVRTRARPALLPRIESHETRAQQVKAILTEAIVQRRLKPGSMHSVRSLAVELDVSRTPVREALLQLARDGMVKFIRNRGIRVLQQSDVEVAEIFEIRRFLEVPITRAAVEKLTKDDRNRLSDEYELMLACVRKGDEFGMWQHDRAFHRILLEASGNRRLVDYVDGLRNLVLTRGVTTSARHARSLSDTARAHEPILRAALAGNAQKAAQMMEEHLRRTERLLIGDGARS